MPRIELPPDEETIRKQKMVHRLCFLFAILDLAILGAIILGILRLFN